jgi:hypothetical protein
MITKQPEWTTPKSSGMSNENRKSRAKPKEENAVLQDKA